MIETLVQRARTYVYTTAMPPLLAHTLLASLALIRSEEWRRDRLRSHIAVLKAGLAGTCWPLLPSDTAIQPLVIGANDAAMAVARALESEGLLVPAIRPPTVPAGTARLRISLSAAHTDEDVARLVGALNALQ
jgi:8-amino-7-oxononanoate synthase